MSQNKMIITAHRLEDLSQDAKEIVQNINDLLEFKLPIKQAVDYVTTQLSDAYDAISDINAEKIEGYIKEAGQALDKVGPEIQNIYDSMDMLNIDDVMFKLENKAVEMYDKINNITEGEAKSSPLIAHTWVLPIPNNLSDMSTQMYEPNDLDITQRLMTKSTYVLTKIFAPSVANKAEDAVKLAIQMGQRHNVVLNPQRVNTYKGTELRRYSFMYNIICENQDKYERVLMGIIALKYFMSGVANTKELYMSQQAIFKIKFDNDHLNEMMEIADVEFNLTGLNVTFGADGVMSMYSSGAVKHIQLTLSFVERKPYYNKG